MTQFSVNRRSGYTLIELVTSMLAATTLIAGLSSAMLISSSAFQMDSGSQANKGTAAEIQSDLMTDLQHALSFSERTANSVTFTVPDRNGDTNPETIRYSWSGTLGDPLMYAYNGGTAVTLVDDVQKFDLLYLTRVMTGTFVGPENVLFVIRTSSPTTQEQLRQTQLQTWGYTVQLIAASDSQSSYDKAFANNDVTYVSEEVLSSDVSTKLRYASIGVVSGEPYMLSETGFTSGFTLPIVTAIVIVDNTHYITSEFAVGSLTVFSSSQEGQGVVGTLVSGVQTLAEINARGTDRPSLIVMDAGTSLYGGGTTPARRVQLPWGGTTLDFSALTTDGLTLLKRSIDWAGEQTPGGATPSFPVPGPRRAGRTQLKKVK